MFVRRVQCATLILCLTGAIANGGTIKKSVDDSARKVTHQTAVTKTGCKRGQQVMDTKRAHEIQAALIRENYLKGSANGVWDLQSKQAMARFQCDNGWQCKRVPDSRALIKLGLGPTYVGLINPETAAIHSVRPVESAAISDLPPGR